MLLATLRVITDLNAPPTTRYVLHTDDDDPTAGMYTVYTISLLLVLWSACFISDTL